MHFFWYDKILFSVNGQEILLGPGNTDLIASDSTRAQNGKYPYFSASLDRALDLLAQNNFFNILSQCWASAKRGLKTGFDPCPTSVPETALTAVLVLSHLCLASP